MSDHPSQEQLAAFLCAELPPAELRPLLEHLARDCEACLDRLARLAEAPPAEIEMEESGPALPPALDAAYDRAIRRAFEVAVDARGKIDHERAEVADALAGRSGEREIEGFLLAAGDYCFGGWAVTEALLEQSYDLRHHDPKRMLLLARLAQTAADGLEPERYGPAPVRDLQARAWAERANAHRVADDLPAAREAMAVAVERCREGSADPLLLARIVDLMASLRADERRFEEALALLDLAYDLCRVTGEPHLAGRALIQKGRHMGEQGRPEEAIQLVREGLGLLEAGRDPRLMLCALQSMAMSMVDCGRYQEARRLLWRDGLWQLAGEDRLSRLRLRWLEARIDAGLGRLGRAETALRRIREGFSRADLPYNQAMASLDLARVCLRQGKADQAEPLLEETVAVFVTLGIGREALAALRSPG